MSRRLPAAALVLLSLASMDRPARAQGLPTLTATVTDLANVIDADRARDLDLRIRALVKASGDAVVVATVPTFAPYASIEEFAVALFAASGVGQQHKDNGVLIVLAVKERRVRIEVGYGLEEILTDGFSGDTIRQSMLPEFRNGRYGAGLAAGTDAIIARIAARRGVTLEGVPPAAGAAADDASLGLGLVLFLLMGGGVLAIILFGVSRLARATGGARKTPAPDGVLGAGTWSGWHGGAGSFGGSSVSGGSDSFSGFGGGTSGGGGASGSW